MLNKIDIADYFDDDDGRADACLLELCVSPSKDLVDKWMPVMSYHKNGYQQHHFEEEPDVYSASDTRMPDGEPVDVPPIEECDQMEVSRLLEAAELAYMHNRGTRKFAKIKWIIPRIRVDLNKRPMKTVKQEISFDI